MRAWVWALCARFLHRVVGFGRAVSGFPFEACLYFHSRLGFHLRSSCPVRGCLQRAFHSHHTRIPQPSRGFFSRRAWMFIYGVRAFVCVRCPCAFGGGLCPPEFSLRDMFNFFVGVWDSICALSALFGVCSDVHFVPTTYEFDGPLAASFRDRRACS